MAPNKIQTNELKRRGTRSSVQADSKNKQTRAITGDESSLPCNLFGKLFNCVIQQIKNFTERLTRMCFRSLEKKFDFGDICTWRLLCFVCAINTETYRN